MSQFYSNFFKDIRDWKILDERIIHDFDEAETPIKVIKIEIGTLCDIKEGKMKPIGPIIRWLPRSKYIYLLENEGTVIW